MLSSALVTASVDWLVSYEALSSHPIGLQQIIIHDAYYSLSHNHNATYIHNICYFLLSNVQRVSKNVTNLILNNLTNLNRFQ